MYLSFSYVDILILKNTKNNEKFISSSSIYLRVDKKHLNILLKPIKKGKL